uniref:Calponin-homology (CH) domain-containing protein n=1 Tax=Arcella intermedia TaxID=1963864 RepID=A0A6B2L7R8_9EUKA
MRSQHVENVHIALDYLQKVESVKLASFGSDNIIDGDEVYILGFIWALIVRYKMTSVGKSELLNWANSKLGDSGQEVKNFTLDWQDGRALTLLLHGLIGADLPILDTPENTLQQAIDCAFHKIKIPKLIDAEDIANNPDEKSLMTYLTYFYDFEKDSHMVWLGKVSPKVPAFTPPLNQYWSDGLVLCSLIEAALPGVLPQDVQSLPKLERVKLAKDTLKNTLKVATGDWSPEEWSEGKMSELEILRLVGEVRKHAPELTSLEEADLWKPNFRTKEESPVPIDFQQDDGSAGEETRDGKIKVYETLGGNIPSKDPAEDQQDVAAQWNCIIN